MMKSTLKDRKQSTLFLTRRGARKATTQFVNQPEIEDWATQWKIHSDNRRVGGSWEAGFAVALFDDNSNFLGYL